MTPVLDDLSAARWDRALHAARPQRSGIVRSVFAGGFEIGGLEAAIGDLVIVDSPPRPTRGLVVALLSRNLGFLLALGGFGWLAHFWDSWAFSGGDLGGSGRPALGRRPLLRRVTRIFRKRRGVFGLHRRLQGGSPLAGAAAISPREVLSPQTK